jgi:GWxTD domain-containing protein
MDMKTNFKIIFLLLSGITSLFAQDYSQRITPFGDPGRRIDCEILTFPASAENKSRVMVNSKIPYDFITLIKKEGSISDEFKGSLDLSVEIFDKDKNSVARKIFQKEIAQNEEEKKKRFKDFIEISMEYYIQPGKYDIIVEINDKESQRNIKKEFKDFIIKNYKENQLSNGIFIKKINNNNESVKFINESGNIPFGENVDLLYIVKSDLKIDSINVAITRMKDHEQQNFFSETFFSGSIISKTNIKQTAENSIEYNFQEDPGYSIIKIPVRSDSFDIRRYKMITTLYYAGKKDTVVKIFETNWVNMPFSLIDFRNAQSKISLIASDAEYSELTSGSLEKQREKFLDFWKKKDPTPKTAYNELMAEFYSRVDFAVINFSSMKDFDGSKTDRGKIYILNGKPDDIKRQLIPNGPPQEIWTYNKIAKRYIFIDEFKQGSFNLSKIEKL